MCGIAGFLGPSIEPQQALANMARALRHRGPDDEGTWFDPCCEIGLVHRRLSIVDLSTAGHQPMWSRDGRYGIVFNGEIYNHQDLRKELDAREHQPWRGHSDTETLLAAFCAWGFERTLQATVGMFALAVWDQRERVFLLARDRMGEKPLYYGWCGQTFVFASELKALRAHPSFANEIDRHALAEFMQFSYIGAPNSIYQRIRKLPPATLLAVRRAQVDATPVPYWSFAGAVRRGLKEPLLSSDGEALVELERRLGAAIAIQRVADVPLGAFLSGGVDSSLIVALMQSQSSAPVHTFSIGFDVARYDEAPHAKAVAAHLGTRHTELYVSSAEARDTISELPRIYDEPFADSSQIPTYLVSRLARSQVTVALSGDAGDELFGGYNRYYWARGLLRIPAVIRSLSASCLRAMSPQMWDRVYRSMRGVLPARLRLSTPGDKAHKLAAVLHARTIAELYAQLSATWSDAARVVLDGGPIQRLHGWGAVADIEAPENQMMAMDAVTYLPDDILCKVDRAAMAVSLETRVPFLDHRVVEFAWRLPLHLKIRPNDSKGKWLLRQLLYRYVPSKLIERPKMGFGVPIDEWLRGPLRDWAEELISEVRLRDEGYFDSVFIRSRWKEHMTGVRNWQYPLWNVLMFQSWLRAQRG